MSLRHRAIEYVEHWYFSLEASVVKAPHSLVTVQEMQLEDAGDHAGVRASGTRRSSGSVPPIRDMDALARRMDIIMRHVEVVDITWRRALENHAKHGSIRKAGAAIAKQEQDVGRITADLWRRFNYGLAVVQSEMVRTGI